MIGIYAITNILNGHRYIGSAIDIKQRWIDHRKRLRKGNHHSTYLQNAWNKYGELVFSFSVLEMVNKKENLISREQEYLDKLRPAYNVCRIAGSTLGKKQPAHVGKAVAEANSKRQHSEETRRKLATNTGKKFTEDHKKKISKWRLWFWSNGGKNNNERTISQFSLLGKFITKYESIAEAARETGLKGTHISRCAKGKRKSTGGFIWKYADGK